MGLAITVTPGATLAAGEALTRAKVNLIATPTVALTGYPDMMDTTRMALESAAADEDTMDDLKLAGITPVKDIVTEVGPRIDVRAYGAIGDGASHRLSERFATVAAAQAVYPFVPAGSDLTEEIDWAAIQAALLVAWGQVCATLPDTGTPPGGVNYTKNSYAANVYIPPGNFVVNKELYVYPHTNIEGADWGMSTIVMKDAWHADATPMAVNPTGLLIGSYATCPAVLWYLWNEEYPVGSGLYAGVVAGSLRNIRINAVSGACIYFSGNSNQFVMDKVWLNCYGGTGQGGLGIVMNKVGGSQFTNLTIMNTVIEGAKIGIYMDQISSGTLQFQMDSCEHGVYIGAAYSTIFTGCMLTTLMAGMNPMNNGMWIAYGNAMTIADCLIDGVKYQGIKLRGKACSLVNNHVELLSSANVTASGWGIHIITRALAGPFGGPTPDTVEGLHTVIGNHFSTRDTPPDGTKYMAMWFQGAAGEVLNVMSFGNVVDYPASPVTNPANMIRITDGDYGGTTGIYVQLYESELRWYVAATSAYGFTVKQPGQHHYDTARKAWHIGDAANGWAPISYEKLLPVKAISPADAYIDLDATDANLLLEAIVQANFSNADNDKQVFLPEPSSALAGRKFTLNVTKQATTGSRSVKLYVGSHSAYVDSKLITLGGGIVVAGSGAAGGITLLAGATAATAGMFTVWCDGTYWYVR